MLYFALSLINSLSSETNKVKVGELLYAKIQKLSEWNQQSSEKNLNFSPSRYLRFCEGQIFMLTSFLFNNCLVFPNGTIVLFYPSQRILIERPLKESQKVLVKLLSRDFSPLEFLLCQLGRPTVVTPNNIKSLQKDGQKMLSSWNVTLFFRLRTRSGQNGQRRWSPPSNIKNYCS